MESQMAKETMIEKVLNIEINGQILVAVSIASLISSFLVACASGLFFTRLDRGHPFTISLEPTNNYTTDWYTFNRTFVNPVEFTYDSTCKGKNFFTYGTFLRHNSTDQSPQNLVHGSWIISYNSSITAYKISNPQNKSQNFVTPNLKSKEVYLIRPSKLY